MTRWRAGGALALVALLAAAAALWRLEAETRGLETTALRVGAVPATLLRPAVATGPTPAVVVAHGFAGSQQLMLPFATTLARAGYLVLTFDFPGHGRNPTPMPGGLADEAARGRSLLDALDAVVAQARALPGADGRVALLGHSMAADIVVRYARAHPDVAATVAVSLFSPGVTATSPRNLLVVDGALEPAMLTDEGRRVVGMAAGAGGAAEPGVTYGDFAAGTARRLALAGGVEHIGVLYSQESLGEAAAWLDAAFGRAGAAGGAPDRRGPWLGVLFAGLVLLARPLSGLLPVLAPPPSGPRLPWRWLLPVALAPAVLTPVLLRPLPTEFLPLLLGDYLAAHFLLYGLLTAVGLRLAGAAPPRVPVGGWRLAAAVLAVTTYGIVVLGAPIDRYVAAFLPIPARLPLIAAMLAGTLPFFAADAWLTRGAAARPGAYALTKLCFLASLMLAVALDPERLFFLIIILPAMLVFLTACGLLDGWAWRRTRQPLVGGLANAAILAWAVAVTFPLVAR